ncbi:hypothetical protein M378DRAFT_163515 [Amanita muscaria Koide BX008]|uniref:Uncharacterized protein n=1 Tax=Amanita muscaria (strain Koide BX008) TaxID=946122 RepID=A0A0C2TBW4_AMAMK|nr:hypothetical protein M378DRAFT_163515 [Amanita muscaria Koide BX008]
MTMLPSTAVTFLLPNSPHDRAPYRVDPYPYRTVNVLRHLEHVYEYRCQEKQLTFYGIWSMYTVRLCRGVWHFVCPKCRLVQVSAPWKRFLLPHQARGAACASELILKTSRYSAVQINIDPRKS